MIKRGQREKIRTLKGFALSLLLHLLILLLFWVSAEKIFVSPPKESGKKISLDLSQFVPPAPKPRPKPQPKIVPPKPIITPKPEPKKVIKERPEPKRKVIKEKKILTAAKATEDNNVTKSIKKEPKKLVKKEPKKVKKIVKKPPIKKVPPKRKTVQKKLKQQNYKSPLANSLMGSSRSKALNSKPRRASKASPSTKRMIKQLYGSEFNSYGSQQKRFIENNLGIIHRITQMTLSRNGYPEVAARTGQQGVNIVSFYLHPNGKISNLRLERHMGYEALDQNTIQVIRLAYRDYPLPRKKTKIKFYVQYSINGY
ncbi:MAG: energy transducer TonB [Campylobacterota bacterium]|nr:energy transducer TonB [Campylobacterota bacterium]